MSARELLNLPPAEWERAIEVMSWRELREVAEKMRRAAKRVHQLEHFADRAARNAEKGGWPMFNNLAPDLLRKISEQSPLTVDYGEWGWLDRREPVSPVLVKRWLSAGLLEDYGVSTFVLSAKGQNLVSGRKIGVNKLSTQLGFSL